MGAFSSRIAVRRALRGGSRPPVGVCGDAEQVARDHAEAHGARHPVGTMIATPVQVVAALEDTDPSLGADAPAQAPAEPALALVRTSGGRFRPRSWQDHASHAAGHRGGFIGGRAIAAITRGQVGGPSEVVRVDTSDDRRD